MQTASIILILWILSFYYFFAFFNSQLGESKKRTFGIFLLFLFFLSLTYFPAITGHYIYHDDVFLWQWNRLDWASHLQFHSEVFQLFRPLEVIIKYSMGYLVERVDDGRIVRFFTLIVVGLIALGMYAWFRKRSGWSQRESFLLSLALVTLPPFQIYVHWMQANYMAVAILLALYATMLLVKAEEDFSERRLSLCAGLPKMAFSFCILMACLLMYPPSTLFMITALTVWLITTDCASGSKINWPWRSLLVLLAAGGTYIIIFKHLVPENAMGEGSIYSNALTSNYLGKLWWFIRQPLVAALNLWNVFPSMAVAAGVAAVVCFGVLFDLMGYLRVLRGPVAITNFSRKYGAILFLVLLGIAAYISPKEEGYFYRSIAFLMTIVLVLLWSGIRNIIFYFFPKPLAGIISTCVLFFMCVFGMLWGNMTLRQDCVDNNSRELKRIENALAKGYRSHMHTIYLLGYPAEGGKGDEFGSTSCRFIQDIPWLLKAAFLEKKISFSTPLQLKVVSDRRDVPAADPHALVIELKPRI